MLTPTDRAAMLNKINECDPLIAVGRFKNGHTYLFRFRLSQCAEAMRAIGHLASDDKSDFSWYDAALVTKQIRDAKQIIESGGMLPDESEWGQ